MKKGHKNFWLKGASFAMATFMAFSGLSVLPQGVISASAEEGSIAISQEEIDSFTSNSSFRRTSVHDPSIVYDGEGTYYVFGSHLGVSKSNDLENWTSIYTDNPTSGIFAEGYDTEFQLNTNAGSEVEVLDAEGNVVTASFGDYNMNNWIANNSINGNMWAPDVIYNANLGKWCMYLSLNGANWNSGIVLLTSDNIEGPYDYVGPVVFSGFSTADSSKSFHDTDIELVIGEQDELPAKYQKISDRTWGDFWPHTIDPAVFYDEDGRLWMVYGSWSGGIYMLELDENTGLRDYTVKYDDNYDELGKNVTSDPYFGKKIAGGYYVSGEGPYIEHIGNYYYLFMSYGFYSPEGGYNMRVFRSENPDGPYVDENGVSAIFDRYIMNYSATDSSKNRGVKLMGGYQWPTMNKAEISQGHNSAIAAVDGKNYLIYHTKFNDGTAGHEVRVHQLFVNEDGWLVTAPYEYAGETISENGYSISEIAGSFGLITHNFQMAYGDLAYNSPVDITLNEDGTITGAKEGFFTITEGTPYCQITLDGVTYKGVFAEQMLGGTNVPVMCFTAVSNEGLTIWGSGEITDKAAIAITASNSSYDAPKTTYGSITLPAEGDHGTTISWKSSNPDVMAYDGTVGTINGTSVVTLTARISKGDYYFEKNYEVTVKKLEQNETDSLVVGEFFKDEEVDLSRALSNKISFANPLYKGTASGLDLSGGVTISFDTKRTGNVNVLGTLFAFQGNGGDDGRMYFTPGSYLGYNAGGSWYDANLKSYALVKDYIGDSAHVDVNLTATGFNVTVNGELAYNEEILATENGDGTIDGKYTKVLKWLYNNADTIMFGSGSWWADVANSTISNVVITVGPIDKSVDLSDEEITEPESGEADVITYKRDKVELTSNSFYEVIDNPFYEKNLEKVTLKYTINMTAGTPQNGWDGIFSFYNSQTGGRVSMQTNPYLCYNSDGWIDVNQPGDTAANKAPYMTPGKEYDVVVVISSEGVTMSVDGEELSPSVNGSTTDYTKILKAISGADQLTFGVGLAKSSYWNTELCTLTNVEFSSVKEGEVDEPSEPETPDEPSEPEEPVNYDEVFYKNDSVVLSANNAKTVYDNPFFGKTIDKLYIAYTIEMTEASAKNGWDSILSFYDTASTGRISVQTAPYLCYNDMSGNWIDFNQPDLSGAVDKAPSFAAGTKHDVTITVTKDGCVMTVDGAALNTPKNGSDTASCKTLLDFITKCDQMTLGVGLADTAFWYTEVCNITDLVVSTGKTEEEVEPADPTEPTEPENPTDPTEPTEPTEPSEPDQPSEPDKPSEPSATLVTRWGTSYYITEDGEKLTGIYTIDGNDYLFGNNGAMKKNHIAEYEGKSYHADANGVITKNELFKSWGTIYYFGEDGAMVKDKCVTVDGYTYYLQPGGGAAKNQIVTFTDGSRYFDGDGHMVTGLMKRWGTVYYFEDNGVMATDKLVTVDGETYYISPKGYAVKGEFVRFEDGVRFFDSNCHMLKDTTMTYWFVKYTFDENGLLVD